MLHFWATFIFMADLGKLEDYRGKWIKVSGSENSFYVPTADQEHFFEELVEDMAFEDEVAKGWVVVAIAACFEEGEPVQSEGLLAVCDDKLIESDEGTITEHATPFSDLVVQVIEDEFE